MVDTTLERELHEMAAEVAAAWHRGQDAVAVLKAWARGSSVADELRRTLRRAVGEPAHVHAQNAGQEAENPLR